MDTCLSKTDSKEIESSEFYCYRSFPFTFTSRLKISANAGSSHVLGQCFNEAGFRTPSQISFIDHSHRPSCHHGGGEYADKDGGTTIRGRIAHAVSRAFPIHHTTLTPHRQLRTEQRLIKIFVGTEVKPYFLQESTLINASTYFSRALDHRVTLGGNELGVLDFSDDKDFTEAWQQVLFWIINKRLPRPLEEQQQGDAPAPASTAEDMILWVKTWVLGDKYCIPRLQNSVMIKLLQYFRTKHLPDEVEHVNNMLLISPIDTPLRRLLSEEVVILTQDKGFKAKDLMPSDGTPGLSASLLAAFSDYVACKEVFPRQSSDTRIKARREYMVGDDYEEEWLTEDSKKVGSKRKRTAEE